MGATHTRAHMYTQYNCFTYGNFNYENFPNIILIYGRLINVSQIAEHLPVCLYCVSASTRAEFIANVIINSGTCSVPFLYANLSLSSSRCSTHAVPIFVVVVVPLHWAQSQPPNTNACILTFRANSQFYCVSFIIKFKATNYILPISMALQLENLTKPNKTQNNTRNINYNYNILQKQQQQQRRQQVCANSPVLASLPFCIALMSF